MEMTKQGAVKKRSHEGKRKRRKMENKNQPKWKKLSLLHNHRETPIYRKRKPPPLVVWNPTSSLSREGVTLGKKLNKRKGHAKRGEGHGIRNRKKHRRPLIAQRWDR